MKKCKKKCNRTTKLICRKKCSWFFCLFENVVLRLLFVCLNTLIQKTKSIFLYLNLPNSQIKLQNTSKYLLPLQNTWKSKVQSTNWIGQARNCGVRRAWRGDLFFPVPLISKTIMVIWSKRKQTKTRIKFNLRGFSSWFLFVVFCCWKGSLIKWIFVFAFACVFKNEGVCCV